MNGILAQLRLCSDNYGLAMILEIAQSSRVVMGLGHSIDTLLKINTCLFGLELLS